MKQYKRYLQVFMLLMAVVIAISCAPAATKSPETSANQTAATATQNPIILKTSITYPATHIFSKGLQYFADLVKERTKGMVQFKIYYNAELISADQEFAAVGSGAIDAAWTTVAYFCGKVRVGEVGNIPFWLTGDIQNKHNAMVELYPLIDAGFQKYNTKNLWWLNPNFFQIPSRKLIKTPADMKGLRIRAAGGYQSMAVEAWGATPVTLTVSETYMAIQRGTADGTLISTPTVLANKFNEVCDYLLALDMPISTAATYMNLDKWKSIPPEYQKIILEAEPEVYFNNDKLWWESDAAARPVWQTSFKGGVYKPTDEEFKQWKDTTASLKERAIKDVPDLVPMFKILDKYNK